MANGDNRLPVETSLAGDGTLLLLSILWLLFATDGALLILGMYVWRIEQREGLRSSPLRPIGLSAIFAITTAMVVWASVMYFGANFRSADVSVEDADPARMTAPVTNERQLLMTQLLTEREAADAELKAAEERVRKLQIEARRARERYKSINQDWRDETVPKEPKEGGEPLQTSTLALILFGATIATIATITAVILLIYRGNLHAILPRTLTDSKDDRERYKKIREKIEHLATAAANGDYASGVDIGNEIEDRLLDGIDKLDALYLRSYCAIQLTSSEEGQSGRWRPDSLIDRAIADLEIVVDVAPRRAEAAFLLGLAYGMISRWQDAIRMFERSEVHLDKEKLPISRNKSVCYLELASEHLSQGDTNAAEHCFQQVTEIGDLTQSVIVTRVRTQLIKIRTELQSGQVDAAAVMVSDLAKTRGLSEEQQRDVDAIRRTFQALIAFRDHNDEAVLSEIVDFLRAYMPKSLPLPDDEAADEYIASPLDEEDLAFRPKVYRNFLFLEAVAQSRLASKSGIRLSEDKVAQLALPLLRGLQFELRDRNLLGALGGLYYWFDRSRRAKAIEWLTAAASMGVESRIVSRILEHEKLEEMEQRDRLEWFKSATAKFLRDPTLSARVRSSLVEEIGRFQEFQPLLVELEQMPRLAPQQPTVELIKERSAYLEKLVEALSSKREPEAIAKVEQLRNEYASLILRLNQTTDKMEEVEQDLAREIGGLLGP